MAERLVQISEQQENKPAENQMVQQAEQTHPQQSTSIFSAIKKDLQQLTFRNLKTNIKVTLFLKKIKFNNIH